MNISSEEIVGRPDALFTQELWRPDAFTAVEILWSAKDYPRCRTARSDSLRLTRETARQELESIREWWRSVEDLWVDGKCVLVVHDGEPSDDEISLWMDLNLVVPWFQWLLGRSDLSIDEIRVMTAWHRIND